MAIQALATVAGFFSDRKLDLTVTITHDAKPSAEATFKLTQDNAIILQMAEVSPFQTFLLQCYAQRF